MKNIQPYKTNQKERIIQIFQQYPYMFEDQELRIIKSDLSTKTNSCFLKLVYIQGSIPIGFIGMEKAKDSTNMWQLKWLAIHRDYARIGIGSKLLKTCEEKISLTASPNIFIESGDSNNPLSIAAKNFYKKLGYKEVGNIPNYYAVDDSKIIFYKSLV